MSCMVSKLLLILFGVILPVVGCFVALMYLPHLLVVGSQPAKADAIFVLAGDGDGSRMRAALKVYDDGFAPLLVHLNARGTSFDSLFKKICPDCKFSGKNITSLNGSLDTRTDAQIALQYCYEKKLNSILVVTSPYHSRRAQFVFNDISRDLNVAKSAEPVHVKVVSSVDYGPFLPPANNWWRDRRTLETVWLEFGKILFWELTPFMEFDDLP